MLAKGSKGQPVVDLQSELATLRLYLGPIDGDFGVNTKTAVVAFQQRYLVDGIVDDNTQLAIHHAATACKSEKISFLPVPNGMLGLTNVFGTFEYKDAGAGNIQILDDWADKNIIKVDLPVVGKQLINRIMEPIFISVFTHIVSIGQDGYINQFGCWSPRHKMHDPKRDLSTHSWAIACDLNWATNPVGVVGDMPEEIVKAFELHGFEWGGRWKSRDDMHFQYATQY